MLGPIKTPGKEVQLMNNKEFPGVLNKDDNGGNRGKCNNRQSNSKRIYPNKTEIISNFRFHMY